jgi:hypothetical protein
MAVFILVCMECYLRPSEVLRLRKKDLVEPSGFTSCWGLVVYAEEIGIASKTQEFDDSLLLDSEWIQSLRPVLAVMKEGNPEASLWTFESCRFVAELTKACEDLHVPRMVPYEMRHSGPSHDRLMKLRPLLQAQKRGRWRTAKSLIRYEKHTRMVQAWNKLRSPVR